MCDKDNWHVRLVKNNAEVC